MYSTESYKYSGVPMRTGFVAYPSSPAQIATEIAVAIDSLKDDHGLGGYVGWEENDVAGQFLVSPILEKIDGASFLVADITRLNFNVAFEVGYAIGKQKRVILVRNSLIDSDFELFKELGIFDTLGHDSYANGRELAQIIASHSDSTPLPLGTRHASGRPRVFLLEPKGKDSYDIQLRAALKKSRIGFENYDPQERGRLSGAYAISSVVAQDAVVARFLPKSRSGSLLHNIRVSFCSGMARALPRELLLLQDAVDDPVPLDFRDYVTWAPNPDELSAKVTTLILGLYEYHEHAATSITGRLPTTLISKVEFGSSIAENESRLLSNYYLETAQFARALAGEYQAITGRKGAGKTAFFIELRNSLRRDPNNIVLDLQPEGFQLLKFREANLSFLTEGTKEHLLTVLWEYVLLVEIANRILRDDQGRHVNDHRLNKPYYALSAFVNRFKTSGINLEGDFAERLERVLDDITQRLSEMIDRTRSDNTLTYPNITELLHRCDISELGKLIVSYVEHKSGVWVLFDNLDKGWPAAGLKPDDLRIVRCLQSALHKIEKLIRNTEIPCRGLIFMRGDVYDRLMNETSDRGKVQKASLDLTSRDILKEILRKRVAYSLADPTIEIDTFWKGVAVPNVSTADDSLEFLLDRCLMRPRCLLDVVRACQSNAITLGHSAITEEDIKQGVASYSTELATNIDFEIRDVFPTAPDVIYSLLGCQTRISSNTLRELLLTKDLAEDKLPMLTDLLLYFGVIGPVDSSGKAHYIYEHQYEVRKLTAIHVHHPAGADPSFEINPAFWSALDIDTL
jgi:hypothetical protein